MKDQGRFLWLGAGMIVGAIAAIAYFGPSKTIEAANDRYEDYVMCTGTVSGTVPVKNGVASQTDGVWLLDYRSGKLLATVIDRGRGHIIGWAQLDLVQEFGIQPRQNVHFLMTTGNLTYSQAALYVAETSTGRFGVYTLGLGPGTEAGVVIRRHDMGTFRGPPKR